MSVYLSLAPFQGITTKHYRNTFVKYFPGLDTVYAPFISGVNPKKVNLSKFKDVLPIIENKIETVPQFLSTNASEIITICNVLNDKGYEHINWNMGCPFPRLANKTKGCGILPFPEKIEKLFEEIIPKIKLKISIKTRLGYYSENELHKVVNIFNNFPLQQLIIHPRTGIQRYKGDVNLETFSVIAQKSKIPITYNGDIYHINRFEELRKLFSEKISYMTGRGSLINPFLPSQIKGIYLTEIQKKQKIQDFHKDLLEQKLSYIGNENKALGQMKALWYYMSGCFVDGNIFFNRIKVCDNLQSYCKFAEKLLNQPFACSNEIEAYWKHHLKHV